MIEWFSVGVNSIWIFACAGMLAVVSFALYQSKVMKCSLGKMLREKYFQVLLNCCGVLFCLGQAGVSLYVTPAWKWIIWLVLAFFFFLQAVIIQFFKR